jgi:hypothetical protein
MCYEAVHRAMRTPAGSASSKAVLNALAHLAPPRKTTVFASAAAIAALTELDRKTVLASLKRLEDRGLIRRTGDVAGQGGAPVFELTFEAATDAVSGTASGPRIDAEAVPVFPGTSTSFSENPSRFSREPVPKTGHKGRVLKRVPKGGSSNPSADCSDTKPAEPKPVRKQALSLEGWLKRCAEAGQVPIPADDPIFTYCARVGIGFDLLELQWSEFKRREQAGGKRQRDWRRKFRNSVEGGWYRLWWIGEAGQAELTTQGRQARALRDAESHA